MTRRRRFALALARVAFRIGVWAGYRWLRRRPSKVATP